MLFLKETVIDTPLGLMSALGDDKHLYALGFSSQIASIKKTLLKKMNGTVTQGLSVSTLSIEKELKRYFKGAPIEFKTSLFLWGTPFQNKVWKALLEIPWGTTSTYSEIAGRIQKERAFRAAANAIGQNPFLIIVPCHRVLQKDGELGGFSAGISHKKWLLNLET